MKAKHVEVGFIIRIPPSKDYFTVTHVAHAREFGASNSRIAHVIIQGENVRHLPKLDPDQKVILSVKTRENLGFTVERPIRKEKPPG